jgi:hypothetical protein
MIKVQPAHSRVVKTETPDRIGLVSPPEGLPGLGGLMGGIGILWILGTIFIAFHPFMESLGPYRIVLGVIVLPGVVLLISGLTVSRRTWTFERTADALMFTRSGLWGTRVRSWTAPDISSLWVEEPEQLKEYRCYLILGFRNGRSEEVMSGSSAEEFRWLAAMLSDPRGSRRVVDAPALAAEPLRKRSDESAVPPTMACRRFETGVELNFHPLLGIKNRGLKVAGMAGLCLVLIILAAVGLESATGSGFPQEITALAVLGLLGYTLARLWKLTRRASMVIDGGRLTLRQNSGAGDQTMDTGEIEFIQTFRSGGRTEMQILLRGKPKLRLFEGRPADELEWAARFLRVALKGRPEPEAAPLRVDAAAGDCQVCGEKMEGRVVYCAKCRTPHHEECWSYVSTCSTYGCREIRFTRA